MPSPYAFFHGKPLDTPPLLLGLFFLTVRVIATGRQRHAFALHMLWLAKPPFIRFADGISTGNARAACMPPLLNS